nr:hypothetical protein [Tanacetum cinerariifolium]
MARLAFWDYHNMVAILEKSEHNVDFHLIVDFVKASQLRIETTKEGTKILATVDGILRTVFESSIRRILKLKDEAGINITTTTIPPVIPSEPLPTVVPTDTPQLRHYTRRARIAQSSAFPPVADEPASHLRDVSQCEACPIVSSLEAKQDKANIAKTSTLPHKSTSRVTSLAADKGSMQQKLDELTDLCTILQRQQTELDRKGGVVAQCGDDAPIKGRSLDEGEEAAEKGSNDTEEMINVLTSMDATTVLSSGVAKVPTSSGYFPTAGPPASRVPTGSDVVPTASLIFATTTVVTPYIRRKGKEKMVESETPKKKKIQEQMDIQMARQLEEEMERDAQRMNEQIARDAEIARIHAEEELQIMIDGLDRSNETVANSASYQFFVDMLKHLDREDLNQLWRLVKETLSIRPPTSDKEIEIWVELKRLYEPNAEDQLWTHTQNMMHAPVEWKLYDSCGVHHVTFKDKEIFMLVKKDYPLRKGLVIVMIGYKLQVENYSQMANDLIMKIFKIANCPSQQDD